MSPVRGEIHAGQHVRPAPALGVSVFIALGGILPLVLMGNLPLYGSNSAWAWAYASTLISAVMFAWVVGSAHRRLYQLMTWLFMYSFLGLAPLIQLRVGSDPSTTPNIDHRYDWVALAIVVLAQICLVLGGLFYRRSSTTARRSGFHLRTVDSHRLAIMSVVLTVGSALLVLYVGIGTLFSSRIARDQALARIFPDSAVQALILGAATMGLLVVCVAQIQLRKERVGNTTLGWSFLSLASAVTLLTIVNPVGSPRYVLMTVLLGLLTALGLFRQIRIYRITAVSALGALLLLFPVLDTFRYSLDAGIRFTGVADALLDGDYDSFGQLNNTVWYVDAFGITFGNQLTGAILFWVPRSLWETKPVDTGILLAESRGYDFSNLSAPLPAELYINFSWVGVIVGMTALGYLIRRWDDANDRRIMELGSPTIVGCILPFYFLLLLRGSLLQATANLAVIVVIALLVTRKRTEPDPLSRTPGMRR